MMVPVLFAAVLVAVVGVGQAIADPFYGGGRIILAQAEPEDPPDPKPRARAGRTKKDDQGRTRPLGSPEVLILGFAREVARAEAEIAGFGGQILQKQDLPGLGLAISAADIGALMTLPILRARLQRKGIGVTVDRNAIYQPAGTGRSYVRTMIGLPETAACPLRRPVRIGVIDGPVDLAGLRASNVSVVARSVLDADDEPGDRDHATSIAKVIAAASHRGGLPGIAPGARLYMAEAFARNGSKDEMRLDTMVAALGWLVSERVELINLSLAGPRNRVLARAMQAAAARGAILVAAAGNDGRDEVAFPAADPNVISVTAVDARKRRYRSANIGNEIDLAAPGVDILIPGPGEATYRSGTSYAAAVVSGLIARELARNPLKQDEILNRLSDRAEDLGRPGRDSEFGWGLVRGGGC